jgi:hypothetical protein
MNRYTEMNLADKCDYLVVSKENVKTRVFIP